MSANEFLIPGTGRNPYDRNPQEDQKLRRRLYHWKPVAALLVGWCCIALPFAVHADSPAGDAQLKQKAQELAQKFVIIDGHIDIPYRIGVFPEDLSQPTLGGDFDFPRARAGGLNAPFMSIYIPAEYQEKGGAKAFADSLIDMVEGFVSQWPDKFAVATSVDEVKTQFAAGLVSLPMGMENGAPVEGSLDNLRHFYRRGIRYITLTHSRSNHICDSSYDENRKWNGLSPFGGEVVAEMNRLGMMIDISHVSDSTFYDVLALTRAPLIASHSSCRHFTPDWERNMGDEMIRKLAENGGVICINFGSSFLRTEYLSSWTRGNQAINAYAKRHGLKRGSREYMLFREKYRKENPEGTLEDVMAHKLLSLLLESHTDGASYHVRQAAAIEKDMAEIEAAFKVEPEGEEF